MGRTDREGEWAAVAAAPRVAAVEPGSRRKGETAKLRTTAQDVAVAWFSIRGSNGVEERKN
jgi:hypothetical protein